MVDATNQQAGKGARTWPVKPSLFLKFSGTKEQMQLDIERTKKITQSNEGSGFAFARNDKEAEEIWHSRKVRSPSILPFGRDGLLEAMSIHRRRCLSPSRPLATLSVTDDPPPQIALWSAIEYVKGAKCWVTDVCVPLSRFPELITETKVGSSLRSSGFGARCQAGTDADGWRIHRPTLRVRGLSGRSSATQVCPASSVNASNPFLPFSLFLPLSPLLNA